MTGQNNIVTMTVNGRNYSGWTSVDISAGIEQTARSFSLTVTHPWPDSNGAQPIRPGDACIVKIGNDTVITGYVDAAPISHDKSNITRNITGRSKTADLIDCAAIKKGGQWKGQKVERIAADLASWYGIKVVTKIDTGLPVPVHQIQQGESVFECLDRLMRARQLFLTDNEKGDLVFIDVGTEKASTILFVDKEKGNVESGSASFDCSKRFSEYVCKGQSAGDDQVFGTETTQTQEMSSDPGIRRRRVLVIKQSGQADRGTCKNRVLFERDSRAGKSRAATFSVTGWRQGDGTLWRPNLMVKVIDPILEINEWMVISSVNYKLDDNGLVTMLNVAPEEAFARQVKGNKAGKKAKKGSGGGSGQWAELKGGV